jgi:hypothetical protein
LGEGREGVDTARGTKGKRGVRVGARW